MNNRKRKPKDSKKVNYDDDEDYPVPASVKKKKGSNPKLSEPIVRSTRSSRTASEEETVLEKEQPVAGAEQSEEAEEPAQGVQFRHNGTMLLRGIPLKSHEEKVKKRVRKNQIRAPTPPPVNQRPTRAQLLVEQQEKAHFESMQKTSANKNRMNFKTTRCLSIDSDKRAGRGVVVGEDDGEGPSQVTPVFIGDKAIRIKVKVLPERKTMDEDADVSRKEMEVIQEEGEGEEEGDSDIEVLYDGPKNGYVAPAPQSFEQHTATRRRKNRNIGAQETSVECGEEMEGCVESTSQVDLAQNQSESYINYGGEEGGYAAPLTACSPPLDSSCESREKEEENPGKCASEIVDVENIVATSESTSQNVSEIPPMMDDQTMLETSENSKSIGKTSQEIEKNSPMYSNVIKYSKNGVIFRCEVARIPESQTIKTTIFERDVLQSNEYLSSIISSNETDPIENEPSTSKQSEMNRDTHHHRLLTRDSIPKLNLSGSETDESEIVLSPKSPILKKSLQRMTSFTIDRILEKKEETNNQEESLWMKFYMKDGRLDFTSVETPESANDVLILPRENQSENQGKTDYKNIKKIYIELDRSHESVPQLLLSQVTKILNAPQI